MKVEPTEKQKKVADEVIRQKSAGENVNKKKAILKAGYSPSVAHVPKLVTESAGYKAYLAKYELTEERVASHLDEELGALGAGERLNHIKFLAQMLGMLEAAKIDINVTKSEEVLDRITNIIDGTAENIDSGQDSPTESDL